MRKRGQYRLTVWFYEGGRYGEETTRDLEPAEFVAGLSHMIDRLIAIRDRYVASSKAEGQ